MEVVAVDAFLLLEATSAAVLRVPQVCVSKFFGITVEGKLTTRKSRASGGVGPRVTLR